VTTETVLKREDHTLSSGDMQPMAPLVPSHLDGKRLVLVGARIARANEPWFIGRCHGACMRGMNPGPRRDRQQEREHEAPHHGNRGVVSFTGSRPPDRSETSLSQSCQKVLNRPGASSVWISSAMPRPFDEFHEEPQDHEPNAEPGGHLEQPRGREPEQREEPTTDEEEEAVS
jgi:hypothetical protein